MRDIERYSRNVRNENRATITTHKNAPRKNEGVNGDIRITTTLTEGIKLFAKYNGEWYSSSLEKEVLKEKRKESTHLYDTNGYQHLGSGLIIQWGREGSDTDGALDDTTTVTFPKEFPNECLSITGTYGLVPDDADGIATDGEIAINKGQVTTSSAQFSTHTDFEYVFWIAIGY